MAKFKVGEEVVDPASGLCGVVVKVEEPMYDWMDMQYEVFLSNETRTHFVEDCLQKRFSPTFLIIGKLEKVSGGTCGLSASFGNIAA